MSPLPTLHDRLRASGQEHLLNHADQLAPHTRQAFERELSEMDMESLNRYFSRTKSSGDDLMEGKLDDRMQPIPSELHGAVTRTNIYDYKTYENLGLEAVAQGKVAVLLLAGGQGTRLGVSYPKGMYNVGLPSGKTLYQIQAERLLRLEERARQMHGGAGQVPWYIMTSQHTKKPTHEFFAENNYFGLKKENLVLFEQGMLPCFDFEGKIILEGPGKISRAPDGNGGLYRALKKFKILEDMQARNIQYVHVYCVDNILVKMADPVFMGYCIRKDAECGAKVVEKATPTEAVGVVCKVGETYQVVEYSEITLSTAQRRNSEGRLMFSAGNICNHFFNMEFLQKIVNQYEDAMVHHVAKKKIPYCDAAGTTIKPSEPNGIKLEKFVFDVFQFTSKLAVWEVIREDEFSPLKNADGAAKDTPTTCRHSVYSLHQRYLLEAGGKLIDGQGAEIPLIPSPARATECNNNVAEKELANSVVVEISPLVSYQGEDLTPIVGGRRYTCPLEIRSPKEGTPAEQAAPSLKKNGTTNGNPHVTRQDNAIIVQ